MGIRLSGGISGSTLVRAIIVGGLGLGLLAAALYFVARRRDTIKVSAEQAKLLDIALGSDDDAERHAASRRLAGLNREALKRIKRLRVIVTPYYTRANARASLSFPEAGKRLLASSGVALVDSERVAADAVLRIQTCCRPRGAPYGGGWRYSGADVAGVLLVEGEGGLLYAGAFSGRIPTPWAFRSVAGVYTEPSDAPFERALEKGLLPPLATLLDAKAVPPLLELLKDGDGYLRAGAAEALGQLRAPRGVEPLIDALKDDDFHVRTAAAVPLGRLRDPRALEPLMATTIFEGWSDALGQLKHPRTVERLITAIGDRGFGGRADAAEALGKLHDPRAVEPLMAALKDADPENKCVRQSAAEALGELGDQRAFERLVAALKGDIEPWVRATAARALGRLQDPPGLRTAHQHPGGRVLPGS